MTRLTVGRDAKQWELYRNAADKLTRRGVIRYWDDVIDLGMNNPFTYAFTTDDDDVVLQDITIESFMSPNKGMGHVIFEIFEGGVVSAGSSSVGGILNFVDIGPTPFINTDEILEGVTIDTPGILKYERNLIGNDAVLFKESFGPFVLNKNTLYQVTLTDQEANKNTRLKISTSAIRIS